MYKLFHVEMHYNQKLDGIEFYIIAESLADAWEDVTSMRVDADIITIRETDIDNIRYFLELKKGE